jgi:hypothetical protein
MPTSSIPPNMVPLLINSTTSGDHRKPVLDIKLPSMIDYEPRRFSARSRIAAL